MENSFFKGALFGGFRRADVIAYIEKAANESKELIAELEQRGDKLARENETLRVDLDAAASERDRLSEERDSLRAEIETLRSQIESVHSLKARVTDLELAAQRRAEDYEAETRRRADDYAAETRRRADEYDTETRRRADDYEKAAHTRLRGMVESCRSTCGQAIKSLRDNLAGLIPDETKAKESEDEA